MLCQMSLPSLRVYRLVGSSIAAPILSAGKCLPMRRYPFEENLHTKHQDGVRY